jgi:hypothetical protein
MLAVMTDVCLRLLEILANLSAGARAPSAVAHTAQPPERTETASIAVHELLEQIHERLSPPGGPSLSTGLAELKASMGDLKTSVAQLQRRANQSAPDLTLFRRKEHSICDASRPLDGIIRSLVSQADGPAALETSRTLTVRASSVYTTDPKDQPSNIIGQKQDTHYHSQTAPGQWVCIDFHERRVIPEFYTLQSRSDCDAGNSHLRNWVLEGSETGDQDSWFLLDFRRDNNDLNGRSARKTFEVMNPQTSRFIRLRQIGPSHHEREWHFLVVAALELFGTLLSPQ